ncbi:MAG: asparagine synthase-related protein [Polyangiaceae bacterium]
MVAYGDCEDFREHFVRSNPREPLLGALQRALKSFSGRVVLVVYEPALARVTLLTDRHGQLPVFVAQAANAHVYVAPRLSPLLARQVVLGKIDLDGLAEALAFGAPFEAKTLVEGVQVLPGAATCSIDLARSAVRIDRYWSPAELLGGPTLPLNETRDELVRLFLEGLDAVTKNQSVAVTLSGGIDSRCLLSAAVHRGIPVRAFNCSLPGSRSARYAEEMARMTGTPYFAFPLGADFASNYGDRLARVVSMTDGLTFFSEVEAHWLRERLDGGTVVLHGAFAELSKLDSMHSYFADSTTDSATPATLADVLFARFAGQIERSLACLDPAFRVELRERARSSFRRRLARVAPGLSTDAVLQVLYLEEFLGKITRASSVVWNDRIPTRFPFAWSPYLDSPAPNAKRRPPDATPASLPAPANAALALPLSRCEHRLARRRAGAAQQGSWRRGQGAPRLLHRPRRVRPLGRSIVADSNASFAQRAPGAESTNLRRNRDPPIGRAVASPQDKFEPREAGPPKDSAIWRGHLRTKGPHASAFPGTERRAARVARARSSRARVGDSIAVATWKY